MRHRVSVILFVCFVLAVVGLVTASQRFMIVGTADGFVPWGVYRCSITKDAETVTRTCLIGVDGLVYRSTEAPDGRLTESWFAHGSIEYRRRVRDTRGTTEVFTRGFSDCWDSMPAPSGEPMGR